MRDRRDRDREWETRAAGMVLGGMNVRKGKVRECVCGDWLDWCGLEVRWESGEKKGVFVRSIGEGCSELVGLCDLSKLMFCCV